MSLYTFVHFLILRYFFPFFAYCSCCKIGTTKTTPKYLRKSVSTLYLCCLKFMKLIKSYQILTWKIKQEIKCRTVRSLWYNNNKTTLLISVMTRKIDLHTTNYFFHFVSFKYLYYSPWIKHYIAKYLVISASNNKFHENYIIFCAL